MLKESFHVQVWYVVYYCGNHQYQQMCTGMYCTTINSRDAYRYIMVQAQVCRVLLILLLLLLFTYKYCVLMSVRHVTTAPSNYVVFSFRLFPNLYLQKKFCTTVLFLWLRKDSQVIGTIIITNLTCCFCCCCCCCCVCCCCCCMCCCV